MSRICDVCGKKPSFGNHVSKSKLKVKRKWLPNLHRIRANISDSIKTVKVCSKCLKAQKVVKVV